MKLRVGVDLGGTTAKLGVVNEQNEIVERKVIPTEKNITFEETVARLADGILSLGDVGTVGFGIPSSLMPGTDMVIYANNLGWKNKDIRGELAKHLGDIPVYVANDADYIREMLTTCGMEVPMDWPVDNPVTFTVGGVTDTMSSENAAA